MSAWVVGREHIDMMVSAGLVLPELRCRNSTLRWRIPGTNPSETGELTSENADVIGGMLWAQNDANVRRMYGDDDPELPGPIDFEGTDTLLYTHTPVKGVERDVVTVIKGINCYRYQCCDDPGWESSQAHEITEVLLSICISCLPGYDVAPWGFDDRNYFASKRARRTA
jgi:hypothetical protein